MAASGSGKIQVYASISPVLEGQIEQIIEQDQLGSKSAFYANLIERGFHNYCEGSNKVKVNFNLRKANAR